MVYKQFTCCLIFILGFVAFHTKGQTSKTIERKKEEGFVFIEKTFDHSFLKYIHTFQCVSKQGDDIPSLVRAIRVQAQSMGANCFKLKNFERNDTAKAMTLTLDTYFADEQQLELNSQLHEKNVIYIFTNDEFSDRSYSFQIDGEKVSLKSGHYYKYIIPVGTEVKINNGGFTGTTVKVNWKENNPSRFFSLTGFALADAQHQPSTVGVAFTTGKINYVSANIGLLLSNVLQQQQ
jgi:hypothetical protein